MNRKTNELVKQLDSIPHWEQLDEQVISWNTAIDMAMKQNLELRRGQLSIEDARRSVQRIALDMIPGINLDAMITEDIDKFQNISADDVEFHTNIVFNFPSLTKIPITYYSAKATEFRAKKGILLKKREVISRIYKASKDYVAARDLYEISKSKIPYNDDGRELRRIEEEWQLQRKRLSSDLSISIGNVSKRWIIDPKTVPVLSWDKYKAASRRLDFLVLTMMAMELEGSRLNMLGIKMQYFPELNVNFYSPSLFSSTAGTYGGVYADSSDMRVNMNLSWRLDTQLRVWHQLKSARDAHKLLVEEIKMRMIERREKIKTLIKSREEFEEWRGYMVSRMKFLNSRNPLSTEVYKKNLTDIQDMARDINGQQAKNTEVEAALIIEYGLL